ncbi:MAG: retroviral-like aspartic protease family protein [Thermodesulfobacteriota bacterium]
MLRCRKCGRPNEKTANFCSHCGARLQIKVKAPRAGAVQRKRIALLGFLAALAAVILVWRLSPPPVEPEGPVPGPGNVIELRSQGPSIEAEPSQPAGPGGAWELVAGEVTVSHHTGLVLAGIPASVVSGWWIALPVNACYGGDRWLFRSDGGLALSVVSGSWRDGEPVALWRLEEGASISGPGLKPWRPETPVSWRSLASSEKRGETLLQAEERLTRFALVSAGTPEQPGLYFQDGHVVGWTFGPLFDRGVLWIGPAGEDLTEDIRVDHFYNLTFANGREERFIHALGMGDEAPSLERLKAFSEGFRLLPELSLDQTPARLRKEGIAALMRGLAQTLDEKGFSREVSDLLTPEVLYEADDAELAARSILATARYYGAASAADRAEEILEGPALGSGPGVIRIRSVTRDLFVNWIKDRIDQADTLGARSAHKRAERLFPEDPEIRLLAVEMALEDKDWRTAEDLLQMKGVPPELADRAARLTRRSERFRVEEGKVVIHFQPGLKNIPVKATLNGSLSQDFLIDTGASLVTIPSGAAEKLGLSLDQNTPEHWVSTAGGGVLAKEVTLGGIELEGRLVEDITAFVLDIPGRPEIGLLGLNFLKYFYVEIDNEQGVLMLKPR